MATGTSDGSDFGGAGHGDGPTQTHFHRFDSYYPERNIHITVFPHGRNGGLQQQINKTARQSGLVPQHVWDSPGNEKFAHHILSADPWKEDYSKMPQGFYAGATGNTTYGAVCWKIPKKRGGQLEISYVTWYFYEAADFSTSIVAKIVPPSYAAPQELTEFTHVATKIARKLADGLESVPPPPAAIILRQGLTGQESGQNTESETPAITDLKLPNPDGEPISSELSTLEIELDD